LRRHRLWEVFLVQKLKFNFVEAHKAACQLEHSTPNLVADRLEVYLEYPATNPEGEPIPRANGVLPARTGYPLTKFPVGQSCCVIRCDANQAGCDFLDDHGICPGASLVVLAIASDNLLAQVGDVQISLARTLAELIIVEPEDAEQ
jgi:DtxR family Mn-dependent transcriptional regulator